ncbi:hypothetical protein [Paracoccus spongiarum]|uniref:Uncharacterized protein n=1 Tax=Paracoccus spongiarum TaxID=3064387 RepID=A0ABT9JH03_9RHOB|nr:hypothetical protein [Paracoccus sp. 2205BS29-5]MDP5309064.1 hypothetical protein [Paracoccus sp. 2205BS29-5]
MFNKLPLVRTTSGMLCDLLVGDDIVSGVDLAQAHAHILIDLIRETGTWRDGVAANSDLFHARARRTSRLGEWLTLDDHELSEALFHAEWTVNGRRCKKSPQKLLMSLEEWAGSPAGSSFVVRSQGDATEMNIAVPLSYVDFKYSGDNFLLGEIANFSWAILAQGAYFVPKYNPAAVWGRDGIAKEAEQWRPSMRCSPNGFDLLLPVSEVRREVVSAFLASIWPKVRELYASLGRSAAMEMAPYLLSRILLTFSPRLMSGSDRMAILALAMLADDMGPAAFFEWLGITEVIE